MCATCGCGGDVKHSHHHDHSHHEHDDHEHPHTHSHSHDHAHHAHTHSHDHAQRDHEHPHTHPHDHDHVVRLEAQVLAKNDGIAAQNRAWFSQQSVAAFNLMSSPGAGKTTLLERTLRDRGATRTMSVIEGDQETARDAERIRAAGARAHQINTGAGCHLDAAMIQKALGELLPQPRSMLFIENVGNLVCPALFDLGEQARVVIASVTEGDDKPIKYPHMFRAADLVVLNKIDLLPHVEFDVYRFAEHTRRVNQRAKIVYTSATRGDGLAEWYGWLAA